MDCSPREDIKYPPYASHYACHAKDEYGVGWKRNLEEFHEESQQETYHKTDNQASYNTGD
jgi:hypothetical protein